MEEIAVEQRYGDGVMVNTRPDRTEWVYRSRMMLSGCSCKDIEKIRRFILRRCSKGGQLTPEQFQTYYHQIDYLNLLGFISTRFCLDGSMNIHVTKTGLEYLAILDERLGNKVDCKKDGEPVLKIYGKTSIDLQEGSDE